MKIIPQNPECQGPRNVLHENKHEIRYLPVTSKGCLIFCIKRKYRIAPRHLSLLFLSLKYKVRKIVKTYQRELTKHGGLTKTRYHMASLWFKGLRNIVGCSAGDAVLTFPAARYGNAMMIAVVVCEWRAWREGEGLVWGSRRGNVAVWEIVPTDRPKAPDCFFSEK